MADSATLLVDEVRWPSGRRTVLHDLPVDQRILVRESGRGEVLGTR